jgi:septum formation protein
MLNEKLRDYKLILASGSPRRQQFFKDLGLDFEIRLREVDEVFPPGLKGVEITDYLAKLKADAFADLEHGELLVTSDTLVWHNGKAVGKPFDADEAFRMIKSLSGSTHEVVTSVCFKTIDRADIINDTTLVTFKPLSDDIIRYYIDTYKPFDKAGAYGIQEWIGYVAVSRIQGSYTNVMGLPVDKVFDYLNALS